MTSPTPARKMHVDPVDVRIEGDGARTLVMIHGWPDTLTLWDAQVAALRGTFRCVRFTLPGFAAGDARRAWSLDEITDLVARVVDTVSPSRPVILLVHDWGSMFGYHYAMTRPDRVERLIGLDVGDAGSAQHRRALGGRAKLMVAGYQMWLVLAWRLGGALGDRMTRAMARWLRAPGEPATIRARMNYPYDIAWTGSKGSYRHARGPRPPMPMPMLYVYGTRKPFMFHSPQWLAALDAQPGCRVVALPTGHWLMTHRAEALNEVIVDWLSDGSAPA